MHATIVRTPPARHTGHMVKAGYVDPRNGYKTSFDVKSGEKAIVVADDIYSGGAVKITIKSLEDTEVEVLPLVFALANLSGLTHLGRNEIIAGASIVAERFPADQCKMCDTGSEALDPRPNWDRLQSH